MIRVISAGLVLAAAMLVVPSIIDSALTLSADNFGSGQKRAGADKNRNAGPINEKSDREALSPVGDGTPAAVVNQTCALNCSVTVPATGVAATEIAFQASVEATACSVPPSYEWNFGEGSSRSILQNPKYTYSVPGTYQWSMRATVPSDSLQISTVAGGFGEGNLAQLATLRDVPLLAVDPLGRGVYVADTIGDSPHIRFINTTTSPVTIAGVRIEAGVIRVIAGGGSSLADDISSLTADLAVVTGLTSNPSGTILYLINPIDGVLRAVNVSASAVTVKGSPLAVGQIRTISSGLNPGVNSIAAHPTDGSVVIADATGGVNQIIKIDSVGTVSVIAGAGGNSLVTDPFTPGPASAVKLLSPRAVKFLPGGDLLISDTGHARIILVNSAGNASLFHQFTSPPNPFPSGIAIFAGNVLTANGNQQTVTRVNQGVQSVIAGTRQTACFYDTDRCGDGGQAALATFYLTGSISPIPVAAIDADSRGLFIADQGQTGRGRIRYINLTGTSVSVAGVAIPAGAIDTIAGAGLTYPYDGGLATSSTFLTPTGVAADANGNLWIADTLASLLRFVNRSPSPVTLFPGTPSSITVPAGRIVTLNPDRTGGQLNGPVKNASFAEPQGIFVTSQGVYIVDSKAGPSVPPATATSRRTSFVRFINTSSSRITFYAGSSSPVSVEPGSIARIVGGGEGSKADGGPATSAVLIGASDVAVTSNGTIYVTDVGQKSVRRIDPVTGVITSLSIAAAQYTGVGLDGTGRLYIANYDTGLVLRETAAGGGSFSTLATGLSRARDVAVDSSGTAYVTVSPPARASGNHQIVQVSSSGVTAVVTGGLPGFSGDDGPAATGRIRISPSELVVGTGSANQLPQTVNIAVGPNNELIFTDSNNNRIRRLNRATFSCERTGSITIVGANPIPQVSSLSPSSALQGGGAFTLAVDGTGFVSGAEVRWNGAARVTTYVSPTRLTATIPAADLATAGQFNVTVSNPSPGGGLSDAATFTVTAPNPLPQLISLNPATAVEGGGPFTLTVSGTGFVSGAIVRWDGQNRATTFVSATQLTAQIPATDIAGAGSAAVTVVNPSPGGGISSALGFTIASPANPTPTLTSISPTSVISGGAAFTLTITGGSFISGTRVEVNGSERVTTYQSPTQLTAAIPATDIASPGTLQVTVRTPSPGGGVTPAIPLLVVSPAPLLTGLNPAMVIAGDPAFTLAVNGLGFMSGATVRINGSDRPTTFSGPTQLRVSVPPTDVAVAGNLGVTVVNPGSPVSNSLTLPVYNRVTAVSSASYATGEQASNSIIAAFGLGLATGVEVNTGQTLATSLRGTRVVVTDSAGNSRDQSLFFVAPNQVNFHLHPETATGTATLTVRTDNNIVALGRLEVGRLVPAIFTQNASGDGVPAAYALRYRGAAVTVVPILTYDNSQSKWVPVPIDLGPEGDVVYLVLFGTGFSSNSGKTGTTVTIRTTQLTPIYSGSQGEFVGLDQINVELPRSLIGAGLVNLQITIDGKVANQSKTMQISIK